MRVASLAAILAAFVVAVPTQVSANALKNAGFEDPTVDTGSALGNWFRFGSGAQGFASQNTTMPRSGLQAMELITVAANQFAGVFQDLEDPSSPGTKLPVAPGQTVVFSGYNKAVGPFLGTRELKIEWIGAPASIDFNTSIGADYEPFSFSAVAPAGTTGARITYAVATFGPGQGDADVFLDDFRVEVRPIPEPGALGLASLGLAAFLRRRNRR